MTWTHLVTLLSIVGFLITAAGLVGVAFRVGRNAQTVSNYRDSADAWEMKAKSQAGEISDLQKKLADYEVLIKKLQDRVQVLEEMVNGHAAINDLAASIDRSFASLQTHLDTAFGQIRDDIRK